MKAGQRRRARACELCGGAAAVHCEADAAFLCWRCDATVHGANFLVARHLRHVACVGCGALDDDRLLTGAGTAGPVRSLCRACGATAAAAAAARVDVSSDESDSGSCISTAESAVSSRPSGARRGRGGGAASRVRLAAATTEAAWSGARLRRRRAWEAPVLGSLEAARRHMAMAVEESWADCC